MPHPDRKKNTGITLKEIATALGVSTMTVSRAINNRPNVDGETRRRILDAARKMGYTPNLIAKSLVSNRTFTIGVVVPEISHSFFPEVVHSIEEVAKSQHYHILLSTTSDDFDTERRSIDLLRSKRVDGILLSSSLKAPDTRYYRNLISSGFPIVFFDRYLNGLGASCIGMDDRLAAQTMTTHLLTLGHRSIGFLCGSSFVSVSQERLEGVRAALASQGVQIPAKWIVGKGFYERDGFQAMRSVLALPADQRPTAVVAVNDPVAIGAMAAVKAAGLAVPTDMAVVGFSDDIRAELLDPPLTTIRQPKAEIGLLAATKLIRLIEHPDEKVETVKLPMELVVRASCGTKPRTAP